MWSRAWGLDATAFPQTTSSTLKGAIQLGIGYTVGNLSSKPERDVLMQDFYVVESIFFPRWASACLGPLLALRCGPTRCPHPKTAAGSLAALLRCSPPLAGTRQLLGHRPATGCFLSRRGRGPGWLSPYLACKKRKGGSPFLCLLETPVGGPWGWSGGSMALEAMDSFQLMCSAILHMWFL